MAIIQIIRKAPKIIKKFKPDKLTKEVIKGAEGSPYKTLDDLGKKPVARNPKDKPGTEKKKLKEAGKKLSKKYREKGLAAGGMAQRGLGRAFMKGGRI